MQCLHSPTNGQHGQASSGCGENTALLMSFSILPVIVAENIVSRLQFLGIPLRSLGNQILEDVLGFVENNYFHLIPS